MVKGSNGWHNESVRHSEARKFGKASGGKVSAPKGVKSISKTRKTKSKYSKGLNNLVIQKDKLLKSIDDLDDKKPNVVSIANKKISVGEAVAFHNEEARKSLKENNTAGYRYHTKEAIRINQKARLLALKSK